MTVERFQAACLYAFRYVQRFIVPNPNTRYKPHGSTGNMAFNAFKIEFRGMTCRAWIDEDIAPYVFYTNEPWTAARWHGKKNPNEGWWDRAVKDFVDKVAEYLDGDVK